MGSVPVLKRRELICGDTGCVEEGLKQRAVTSIVESPYLCRIMCDMKNPCLLEH